MKNLLPILISLCLFVLLSAGCDRENPIEEIAEHSTGKGDTANMMIEHEWWFHGYQVFVNDTLGLEEWFMINCAIRYDFWPKSKGIRGTTYSGQITPLEYWVRGGDSLHLFIPALGSFQKLRFLKIDSDSIITREQVNNNHVIYHWARL